jgi:DNA-directed RNA polymerase subunit RPC12/RpoP
MRVLEKMEKRYYECERCGRTFQTDDKGMEPRCPVCSSQSLKAMRDKDVRLWSCAPRAGFS